MAAHRGRRRHHRRHRLRAVATRRRGVRRTAEGRPALEEGGGRSRGRVGQGRVRRLRADFGRSAGGQRRGCRRARAGQFRCRRQGVVLQAENRRQRRTRRPDGRGRLQHPYGMKARTSMTAHRKHSNEPATNFPRRHIGPSPRDIDAMLETVGAKSLAALMGETLPASIRQQQPLDLGAPLSETEALKHMTELAAQNQVFTSLIGQGYSGTILPPVIQRNILENPAWLTAYTPYQPEISQGRLEALFNFQTMICDLTGLDVANASLLDEGTAAAEAMALAERSSRVKTKVFFVDSHVHPQTIAVLRPRAEPLGWTLIVGDPASDLDDADVFGGLLQYPD